MYEDRDVDLTAALPPLEEAWSRIWSSRSCWMPWRAGITSCYKWPSELYL